VKPVALDELEALVERLAQHVVTFDFGAALNNALTIKNQSLASVNANVDLFSGMFLDPFHNFIRFSSGSNVAAAAAPGDRIDIIFDVNRDGIYNSMEDATIVLVGAASNPFSFVFDPAADKAVLTIL
jgi:hypothetical protein